jgi:hypothetical protein
LFRNNVALPKRFHPEGASQNQNQLIFVGCSDTAMFIKGFLLLLGRLKTRVLGIPNGQLNG